MYPFFFIVYLKSYACFSYFFFYAPAPVIMLVLIKGNAPKKTILIGPINPIRTYKNYFPFI